MLLDKVSTLLIYLQSSRKILPALVSENYCIPRKLLSTSPTSLVVCKSQCLCLDNGKQTETIRGSYMSRPQMEQVMGIVNEKVAALNNVFLHREVIIRGQVNRCADVWGRFCWTLYICSNTASVIAGGGHQTNHPCRAERLNHPSGVSHFAGESLSHQVWTQRLRRLERSSAPLPNGTNDNMSTPPTTPGIMSTQDNLSVPCWIMRFTAI
jgi:hypothetical protein